MTLKCKSLSPGPSHELTVAVLLLVSVAYRLKCMCFGSFRSLRFQVCRGNSEVDVYTRCSWQTRK